MTHPCPSPPSGPGGVALISGLPLCVESKKLAPKFIGPFPIEKIINLMAVRLALPRTMRSLSMRAISTPLPLLRLVDVGLTFTAHHLVHAHRRGRGIHDREGYGPEEKSWVPAQNILEIPHQRLSQQASRPTFALWASKSLNLSTLTACPSTAPVSEEDSVPEEDLIMEHEEPSSQPLVV